MNLKPVKDDIKRIVTAYLQEIEDAKAADAEAEEEGGEEEEEEEEEKEEPSRKTKKKIKSDNKPQYYWVISPALMAFLGVSSERMDFKEAQMRVQEYVKTNLTKNENDRSKYVCDEKLTALIGLKNIKLFGVGKQLKKHCKQWFDAPAVKDDDDDDDDDDDSRVKTIGAHKKGAKGRGAVAKDAKSTKGKNKRKTPSGTSITDIKRPQSAYFLWMNNNRDRIKEENPGISFGEVAKLAGAQWKELSAAQKAVYEEMSAAAKNEYNAAIAKAGGKSALKKAKASQAGDKGGSAKGGFAVTPYRLSAAMQTVCGVTELPRPQVVKKIWEYVKARDLQNPTDKRQIVCDAALRAIFEGNDVVTAFSMNKYISAHLTKIE